MKLSRDFAKLSIGFFTNLDSFTLSRILPPSGKSSLKTLINTLRSYALDSNTLRFEKKLVTSIWLRQNVELDGSGD